MVVRENLIKRSRFFCLSNVFVAAVVGASNADEAFTPTTARVLLRPEYVGFVLHPNSIGDAQDQPIVGKWTPTDAQIAKLEAKLVGHVERMCRDRNVANSVRKTYFRQYYGYSKDNQKKICVTLLSPGIIGEGAEVAGEPSPAVAIKVLASGVVSVWDADHEWQQYFFDVEKETFSLNP